MATLTKQHKDYLAARLSNTFDEIKRIQRALSEIEVVVREAIKALEASKEKPNE